TIDWASCVTDPSRPAGYTAAADTACISFNGKNTAIHVHLPATSVKSDFGQFAGVKGIVLSASATAGVSSPLSGRILPLAIQAGETGKLCVENSGNDSDCANRFGGNFGDLNSPRLSTFTSGNDSEHLMVNYAIGLDHGLG